MSMTCTCMGSKTRCTHFIPPHPTVQSFKKKMNLKFSIALNKYFL